MVSPSPLENIQQFRIAKEPSKLYTHLHFGGFIIFWDILSSCDSVTEHNINVKSVS